MEIRWANKVIGIFVCIAEFYLSFLSRKCLVIFPVLQGISSEVQDVGSV